MKISQICLNSRPKGWVTPDNFAQSTADLAAPGAGELLLKTLYLSVDPYMRGRMNDVKSYIPPFQIGAPVEGGVVAEVVESNGGPFEPGTIVVGMGPWSDYFVHSGAEFMPVPKGQVPLSYFLGILGMPGMTAYVGLKAVAKLEDGEQVFVSAASGAVGQVVGQIAKQMGCHVSGSAGADDKVAYLTDTLGFDAAFNYKTSPDLMAAVRDANPKGIDVYFENVGGPMLEAVLNRMNSKGRIAVCGMISDYNSTLETLQPGPRNLTQIVRQSLRMEGFIVFNYRQECQDWVKLGSQWLAEGKIQYRESVADGLAAAPGALISMLKGENFGKQVVHVADPS